MPFIERLRQQGELKLSTTAAQVVGFESTDDSSGNAAHTSNTNAWNAMVRDRIRAALQTWKDSKVPGKLTTFGSGCDGSNGTPPHDGVGLAQPGSSSSYGMEKGPKNGIVLLALGFSKQMYGAIPLPLDLTPFGAAGCKLQVTLDINFTGLTSPTGSFGKLIPIPNDPNLVGASFRSRRTGPSA